MLLSDSNKIGHDWYVHHISHSPLLVWISTNVAIFFINVVQICRRLSASMGLYVHFSLFSVMALDLMYIYICRYHDNVKHPSLITEFNMCAEPNTGTLASCREFV